MCLNAPLQAKITLCVTDACTIREALGEHSRSFYDFISNFYSEAKNATSVLCNEPIRDLSNRYHVIVTTLGVITGVVVFMRGASKFIMHQEIFWDDYLMLLTFFACIPSSVMAGSLLSKSIGKDIVSTISQH